MLDNDLAMGSFCAANLFSPQSGSCAIIKKAAMFEIKLISVSLWLLKLFSYSCHLHKGVTSETVHTQNKYTGGFSSLFIAYRNRTCWQMLLKCSTLHLSSLLMLTEVLPNYSSKCLGHKLLILPLRKTTSVVP